MLAHLYDDTRQNVTYVHNDDDLLYDFRKALNRLIDNYDWNNKQFGYNCITIHKEYTDKLLHIDIVLWDYYFESVINRIELHAHPTINSKILFRKLPNWHDLRLKKRHKNRQTKDLNYLRSLEFC